MQIAVSVNNRYLVFCKSFSKDSLDILIFLNLLIFNNILLTIFELFLNMGCSLIIILNSIFFLEKSMQKSTILNNSLSSPSSATNKSFSFIFLVFLLIKFVEPNLNILAKLIFFLLNQKFFDQW